MKVLVGCEFSGIVRDAFRKQGHDAISCDLLPTEQEGPHYQGNVLDMLDEKWDLIIMHPDCTALCNAGNKHYAAGTDKYHERVSAARWTRVLWNKCRAVSRNVVFENPPGVLRSMAGLPKPQWVQPYEYGHMEQKKTGLYMTPSVPHLVPTNDVWFEMMELPVEQRERVFHMGPSETRWMDRARTYTGIAEAMAEQWGKKLK